MRRFKTNEEIDLDDEDIEFVVQQVVALAHRILMRSMYSLDAFINNSSNPLFFNDMKVWRTRCAVSARKIGGHAPLILTRWYADQPPVPYNLVLMQRPYAMLLEEGGHAALPVECRQRIESRLVWAEQVCRGAWESPRAATNSKVAENQPVGDSDSASDKRRQAFNRTLFTSAIFALYSAVSYRYNSQSKVPFVGVIAWSYYPCQRLSIAYFILSQFASIAFIDACTQWVYKIKIASRSPCSSPRICCIQNAKMRFLSHEKSKARNYKYKLGFEKIPFGMPQNEGINAPEIFHKNTSGTKVNRKQGQLKYILSNSWEIV